MTTARAYTLRKRAERQAQTRQRIVAATVGLHETVGPARTTISAIAQRAGVQRHTVYAHFPDERELTLACSGFHLEAHPLPDPEPLTALDDPDARARRAIELLYRYFEDQEAMLANILRDAEVHAPTREAVELRIGPTMARFAELLVAGTRGRRRARRAAAVAVALDFRTWQSLVRGSGLRAREAVNTAAAMLRCQ